MGKQTTVDLAGLKAALQDLTRLQQDMAPGNSDSAVAYTGDLDSIGPGLGPLLADAGPTITRYVDARRTALVSVHTEAASSMSTVSTLLGSTITNYENNERTHRAAADGTGTSGSGPSGSGSGTAGGADQKG